MLRAPFCVIVGASNALARVRAPSSMVCVGLLDLCPYSRTICALSGAFGVALLRLFLV